MTLEDEARPIAFVPFEYDPRNRLPTKTHHKSNCCYALSALRFSRLSAQD